MQKTMTNIIKFPTKKRNIQTQIEGAIENALLNVKPEYKDRIKQKALESFKKHEAVFTTGMQLELPDTTTEEQISRIQEAYNNETEIKLSLVSKIMVMEISKEIDQIEKENI